MRGCATLMRAPEVTSEGLWGGGEGLCDFDEGS